MGRHLHMGWKLGLVICLSVSLLLAGRGAGQNAQISDPLLQQGQKLYEAGKLDEAIAVFRQDVAQRPNDPNVVFALAAALSDQGALQESETDYKRAIMLFQQLEQHSLGSGITYKPNIAMSWNNL